MRMRTIDSVLAAALAVALGACGSGGGSAADPGGIGDPCTVMRDCRWGLACRVDGTCGPAGLAGDGETCTFTEDCSGDSYCAYELNADGAPVSVCRRAGTAAEGDPCGETAECERGLVCMPAGFEGECRPGGTGDLGDPCDATDDCYAGLACNSYGVCGTSLSAGGPGFPIWTGVECAATEGGDPRFYFEVPRGDLQPGHDFFRLPWPNDARRAADGSLDLQGFPHPALEGVPFDLVDRFLRASESDLDGFGTNGAIFFRSSVTVDFDALFGGGSDPVIYFVDLTPPAEPGAPYGRVGFGWAASTGGGRYICPNWIAVRTGRGAPLLPGRTYAVVLTDGIRVDDGVAGTADGAMMVQDADFATVLSGTRPEGDPEIVRAWAAYAPFRGFLAAETIDPGSILGAAVFTTQDVPDAMRRARDVALATDPPAPSDAVLCDTGVVSPCDDGLSGDEHVRGCFAADPAFQEIQGRFLVPIFQTGTPPYKEPEDGGGFEFDADGDPVVQRTEDVCFTLTIPTGVPMPAGGWPVVVYTHGTGGDYRSAIRSGVVGSVSSIDLDDSSTVAAAVLSFDQVEHGPRRGASTESPNTLFFNFANPGAAYGNVLQGAIDGVQAVRLLAAIDFDGTTSPTGEAISFDTTKTYYYGHSQGSTHGLLTLAVDGGYQAAVLSGAGASLIESLLTKTSPINIAGAVRMALADPSVSGIHPALTIFQMYMERADPVNYGRYLLWEPPGTNPPKHLLQTYGVDDTYSTRDTMLTTAAMLGVQIAAPPIDMAPDEAAGWAQVTLPATGNQTWARVPTTAVLSQHDPLGAYDGHFVSTSDATAIRRIAQFVGTAIRDGTPTVVE